MECMRLKEQTERLLGEAEACSLRFEQARAQSEEPDFYRDVKPCADRLSAALEQWEREALAWVAAERPRHLTAAQVRSATGLLGQAAVQSFYPSTSRKRLSDSIRSVRYTLGIALRELRKGGGAPHEGDADDPRTD